MELVDLISEQQLIFCLGIKCLMIKYLNADTEKLVAKLSKS